MAGGVRSLLVIPDATERDFGLYNCSVSNGYGADSALIILEKQSECGGWWRCRTEGNGRQVLVELRVGDFGYSGAEMEAEKLMIVMMLIWFYSCRPSGFLYLFVLLIWLKK